MKKKFVFENISIYREKKLIDSFFNSFEKRLSSLFHFFDKLNFFISSNESLVSSIIFAGVLFLFLLKFYFIMSIPFAFAFFVLLIFSWMRWSYFAAIFESFKEEGVF